MRALCGYVQCVIGVLLVCLVVCVGVRRCVWFRLHSRGVTN